MRNRSLIQTALAGLVLALVLFSYSLPGLAQTRVAAMPGDGQVTLSWGAVEGATSYNLYMATQPGVSPSSTSLPDFMAHTGVNSPFTHTGLTNGTKYFFLVTALTPAGEKPVSPGVASVPSANVAAAIQGVYAFLDQLRSALNAHNPPVMTTSDLSYTHLTGFFDSAFLNEGRDAVYEAKRMAQEMRDSPAIESLVIDHVNFFDETNQVISVGGTAIIGGISEYINGHEDGLFIVKRQADNTTWLAYGDQRIVKGHFQVEMRTDQDAFFSAGPRQHVNFDIEAPIGTIASASVIVPGMATPLQLQSGQIRVETIVGDLAQGPEIFERDSFYGGFDPGTTVQHGTTYTLSVTKAEGGSVDYPLVFRGVAVTDAVAGAINVTSPTGHTFADAQLGSPLAVQWTLPTAYPIVEVRLDGWAGNQNFSCSIDNQGQFLAPNATSGTITLPTLCNGEALTYAGFAVSAQGENGQRSAFMHGFSSFTGGSSSTTTTTTGGTTTTTGSTTTTTQGGTGGQVTLNFSAGWNLVGNSNDANLDVATAFGDTSKVTTVWKWVASTAKWAFYAPSLVGQALTDYATSKGYDVLATIAGGEGFWVNSKGSFTAQLPAGSAISSASYQAPLTGTGKLVPGWNLIAIGDNKSPSEFNKALSSTPPAPGEIPLNVTTLWAWDGAQSNWYFYAPSLEKNGTLSSYIQSKSYLDFGTRTLDPAAGFWVNKP